MRRWYFTTERLISIHRMDAAWLNIGNTMLKIKRYDYVDFFLKMAERINPKMAEVVYTKGVLVRETGQNDIARVTSSHH